MKTSKKLALVLGVATGAAVALMTFGKTGKKNRNLTVKKRTDSNEITSTDDYSDSDFYYI